MLEQNEQDKIWDYVQDVGVSSFALSETRLQYLAKQCTPNEKVLNIGIGSGFLETLLVSRGVTCYSLDPSQTATDNLIRKLPPNSVVAKVGYSNAIPFERSFFDKVIMTEVLEHLTPSVFDETLDEVRRVLRRGGVFFGTVPYREDLKSGDVICPKCSLVFHRWGHNLYFDSEGLRKSLDANGFNVKAIYPRCFPDYRWKGPKAFLRSLFRDFLGRLGEPIVGPNLYFYVYT